jgi:hypothetical protein
LWLISSHHGGYQLLFLFDRNMARIFGASTCRVLHHPAFRFLVLPLLFGVTEISTSLGAGEWQKRMAMEEHQYFFHPRVYQRTVGLVMVNYFFCLQCFVFLLPTFCVSSARSDGLVVQLFIAPRLFMTCFFFFTTTTSTGIPIPQLCMPCLGLQHSNGVMNENKFGPTTSQWQEHNRKRISRVKRLPPWSNATVLLLSCISHDITHISRSFDFCCSFLETPKIAEDLISTYSSFSYALISMSVGKSKCRTKKKEKNY